MGDQAGGGGGGARKDFEENLGTNYLSMCWTGILQFAQWKSFQPRERKSAS
jgi:hypothetical protein